MSYAGIRTTDRYEPYMPFLERVERLRREREPLNFTPAAMALGRDLMELLYAEASEFRDENFIDLEVRQRMIDWLEQSGKLREVMLRYVPAGMPEPTDEQRLGIAEFVFAFFTTKLVEMHDDIVLRCIDLSEAPDGEPLPTYHRPTPLGLPEEDE